MSKAAGRFKFSDQNSARRAARLDQLCVELLQSYNIDVGTLQLDLKMARSRIDELDKIIELLDEELAEDDDNPYDTYGMDDE